MMLTLRLRYAMLLALAVALSGCLPPARTQLDEEKEPHFLEGKRRANALDYPGAIESFEKAIAVNPHSSAAHFEAALLYEKNQQDYAAAIYHFQKFLDLRPGSDYADVVRQRILACKQELARTISLGPVTQSLQHEFEQLAEENKRLHEEIERWRAYASRLQLATNPPAVSAAPAVAQAGPPESQTGRAGTPPSAAQSAASVQRQDHYSSPSSPSIAPVSPAFSPSAARTHTVKPGDTPAGIARKYGIRLDALMAANPGLDPRRLRIGQTISLPTQQLARN